MKTYSFYFAWFLLQLLTITALNAQPLIWDKTYSFPEKDQDCFTKILQTGNSDIYLAGYGEFGWCQRSPGFMRIDTNGNQLWERAFNYPDSYMQITYTLAQLSANSYYSFCFNPLSPVPINLKFDGKQQEITNDSWLLKLNNDGDTVFATHFENIGWVNDLIIDNDKLIAVGSTNYHEEDPDAYFSKTTIMVLDTNGKMLWRNEYLTDLDSRANSIIKNEQGNYLITGTTVEYFGYFGYFDSPDKMFLLEVDTDGNLLSEYFSDIEYCEGKKIIVCEDGNYAIVGDGLNPDENMIDIVLWKFDTENNLLQTTFSGLPREDEPYSIKQTPDGGFIICGYIVPMSSTNWNHTFFYMKTDSEGNEEWHTNNVAPHNCAFDVLINNNSGYYFAGKGAGKARLVKSDLEGNGLITTSVEAYNYPDANLFKLHPNPGEHFFVVKSPDPAYQYTFSLYDFFGNRVINTDKYSGDLNLDASYLPEGLYFYQIKNDDGYSQSGKWMKE